MTTEDYVTLRLARGGRARRVPDGYMVTCPAHADGNPSLHVTEGRDGVPLLHCMAGCLTADVLAADDLAFRDLYPNANGKVEVAVYPYCDEQGAALFEQVRFEPKDFRLRRPDGSWGVKGVRLVPYHLPELLVGIAAGEPVFVCEGEKDVHALERAGCVATCNPMGAGKWHKEYADFFLGHDDVRVIADRDEAGRKHAAQILASMAGKAAARLYEPAEGKDASDHLRAGLSPADFIEQATEAARALAPAPARFLRRGVDMDTWRPTAWAWQHRIVHGTMNVVYGKPSIGKGVITDWIIARLTRGELPGALLGIRARVLWIGDEDDWDQEVGPRLYVAGTDLSRVEQLIAANDIDLLDVTKPGDLAELDHELGTAKAQVLVFEALYDHMPASVNPNDPVAVRAHLHPIRSLLRRRVVTGLATMHEGKGQRVDAREGPAGSHQYNALSRSTLLVADHPHEDGRRVLARTKGNYSIEPPILGFTIVSRKFDHNGFEFDKPLATNIEDEPDLTLEDLNRPKRQYDAVARDEIAEAILGFLAGLPLAISIEDGKWQGGAIRSDIARAVDRPPTDGTVGRALRKLADDGLIETNEDKQWRLVPAQNALFDFEDDE